MPEWWSDPKALDAYVLSIISLVVTLAAAIGGLLAYKVLDDSLLFVYGLENCVDFLSSAIVVWRFNRPGTGENEDRHALLEAREKRAEIAISIVILMLGFGSITIASKDLSKGFQEEEKSSLWTLYYLAFFSLVVFGTMAMFKFRYAEALNSPSLYKDGLCSLIGASLALSLFFNTVLSLSTGGKLWWLDPSVALLCGVGSLIYGLYSVYVPFVKEGLPIFSPSWWTYSAKSTSASPNELTSPNDLDLDYGDDTVTATNDQCAAIPESNFETEAEAEIETETETDRNPASNEVEMTPTTVATSGIPPVAATPPASSFMHSQPSSTIPTPTEQTDVEAGVYPPLEKVDITTVDLT